MSRKCGATWRLILLAQALIAAPGAAALAAGLAVSGPAEVVFDWTRDRCARWDIPDTPARAWREADGSVALLAGSEASRAARGPSLEALARDCAVLHRGAGADDPEAHDDRAWIAALYAHDDGRLEALAHVEYHGHRRPARCAGDYSACWANAVVALEAAEDGRGFRRTGLVAASPYRYDGEAGRRTGYFNPSNILRSGDFLHVFVFAEAQGAQARGACLLRRPVAGGDWLAWDGAGFAARLGGAAPAPADPAAHVCAPLPGVVSTISGVVRHAASGRFLAVTPATRRAADGETRSGVWWMASDDLVAWSEPELLLEAPLLWRRDCAAPAAFAYPSLIDPASASASFETVGDAFWLYLVEMPLDASCRVGPRRNLIRLPLSWRGG